MSLLIKGMEMPLPGGYIDVRIFANGTATQATGNPPYFREYDVDYVPTPHGRLVDENAVYDSIAELDHCGNYVDMDAVGRGIEYTPTIIEAEESEEPNA